MKNTVMIALLGAASVQAEQVAVQEMEDETDLLFSKLETSLTNLVEAQQFYNGIPSVAEYDGHHFHNWDVLPQDLPEGGFSQYVTPTFKKVFWNEKNEGLPDGYRFLYIDELLQNEHNLNSKIQSYLPSWDIVAVINGWTDGPGYGGSVVKDGGSRNVGWILLVNEDYPVWIDTFQGPWGQQLLVTPSVTQYGGYHYNQWEVLPEDVPTAEITQYTGQPSFIKKFWNEQHQGVPAGYRHMFIDELIANQHGLKSRVQSYLPSWDIVAVINGWTDGPGYGGSVVKDGGSRAVGWILFVNEDYPVLF